jgi:hypothetical protein
MSAGHIPGPWTANASGLITAGPRGLHIAQAAQTGLGYAADHNARLIAAAPQLLDALRALYPIAARQLAGAHDGAPILAAARAAIEAAETPR